MVGRAILIIFITASCLGCASSCQTGCNSCGRAGMLSGRLFSGFGGGRLFSRFTGGCDVCGGGGCDVCCPNGSKACKPRKYWAPGGYNYEFDEKIMTEAARRCSSRELACLERQCGRWLGADFRCGYQQAYIDVALGSNGEIPYIPPKKYWRASERSAEGRGKAQEWFAGYQAGAQAALQQEWSVYRNLPTPEAANQGNCEQAPMQMPAAMPLQANPQPQMQMTSPYEYAPPAGPPADWGYPQQYQSGPMPGLTVPPSPQQLMVPGEPVLAPPAGPESMPIPESTPQAPVEEPAAEQTGAWDTGYIPTTTPTSNWNQTKGVSSAPPRTAATNYQQSSWSSQ